MVVNTVFKEYALLRGKIVVWNDFLAENPWATTNYNQVPKHCISVYYCVDLVQKTVTDRLCVVTYDEKYKSEFKELSLVWVSEHFVVEESDIKQVETPEEVIIKPGGEIFFVLNSEEVVVGVVATVIHKGDCELAKMTVRKGYTGRGYANVLMKESIQWAKDNNYPFIELLSSTKLENAINIYKKFGFVTTHLGSHPDYARCDIIMRLTF
jgi:GNAT superfamily N-acetyltransferase